MGTRAVILTAAGETFSAGADLSALQDGAADAVGTWLRWGHRLTDAIAALPQPTLTAINGLAAGRRLRAGAGYRSAPAGPRRPDRLTTSTSGDDPGLGRHPTVGAPGWAERGEGVDLYRSSRRLRRGAAPRPRERRPPRPRTAGRRAGPRPASLPCCPPEPLPVQRRPSAPGWTGTSLRATRSKWQFSSACPADSNLLLDLRMIV